MRLYSKTKNKINILSNFIIINKLSFISNFNDLQNQNQNILINDYSKLQKILNNFNNDINLNREKQFEFFLTSREKMKFFSFF